MTKIVTTNRRGPATLLLALVAIIGGLSVRQTSGAGKTLITINDLQWQGAYGFPAVGSATAGGPGTTSYASGALAVRYVNGQRRFLMPTFTNADLGTGQLFGDLVEWQAPSDSPYAASNASQAPKLLETRRWKNWTLLASSPAWQEPASGVRVGGLLWDEENGVLWYQLYGYYSGKNHPLMGATQLLDTPAADSYRAVGRQYGPWWYRSNDLSDRTNLYWKAVCNWIVKVPDSSVADLRGSTVLLGGTVGAVGGAGNLGPGFRGIPRLPALTDPPNSTIAMGVRLADYTNESPMRPSSAHREANYRFDGVPQTATQSGLFPPNGSTGYWQMSLDQVNSFIWVDTPTKEGILMFGRQSVGLNWYGFNPRSATPSWPGGTSDAVDPTRQLPDANGYGSTSWRGALYVFDPAQVREVGRGTRSPWSDGINPVTVYDWKAQWPNLPMNQFKPAISATQSRPIESNISNSGFWDPAAQEIIWVQPNSVGAASPQPMLNIFRLGNWTPPRVVTPPSNVRITR